ncbi:hypothetical protein KA478_02420 [Patescibacteria group bacterium]|nr:hypothetical protein [Patescibacteria group bacterium]
MRTVMLAAYSLKIPHHAAPEFLLINVIAHQHVCKDPVRDVMTLVLASHEVNVSADPDSCMLVLANTLAHAVRLLHWRVV